MARKMRKTKIFVNLEKSKKGEAKMNAMGEIINVVVVKNIYPIQLYILILKPNMMVRLLKEQMPIKFKMVKVGVDQGKIF